MEALLLAAGASTGTAATVSTVASIASTAFTAVGALSQGATARSNYKAQANASEYNAAVARNESERALQESTAAQLAHRRKVAQVLGQQRAATVQSGTGTGGTNADLYERSESLAELDALNLAYEGDVKSRGYMAQSDLDSYYAGVSKANASAARSAGYFGAGTALVSGASRYGGGTVAPRSTVVGNGLTYGGGLGIKNLRLSGDY